MDIAAHVRHCLAKRPVQFAVPCSRPKETEAIPHCYIFLLFRDPETFSTAKESLGREEFVQRRSFKAAKFIEENKLELAAVNWFRGVADAWKP